MTMTIENERKVVAIKCPRARGFYPHLSEKNIVEEEPCFEEFIKLPTG